MKPFTRRLIKKEVARGYIYIGKTRSEYFPEPGVEFTLRINEKEFKTRTYDWHCACRCPNPAHIHRCMDTRDFKHLLSGDSSTLVISKVADSVYELVIIERRS